MSNNHYNKLISRIFYKRGQARYEIGSYSDALEDFKKINNLEVEAQRHNNIGICYYQLGLYVEAEEEYIEAIKSNSRLPEPYYNLAVLYNTESHYDKSKKMLSSCLKVERNFSAARDAMKRLQGINLNDWYTWWFGYGRVKKVTGGSLTVVFFIIAIIIMALRLTTNNANTTDLIILLGLTLGFLLFPSLRKIKVGNIELESVSTDIKNIRLEPALSPMTSELLDLRPPTGTEAE